MGQNLTPRSDEYGTGAIDLVGKGQGIIVYPYAVHRRQEQLGEVGLELTCTLSLHTLEGEKLTVIA